MLNYLKKYTIFLICLLSVVAVAAQNVGDYTFSHIGTAEGMGSQRVFSIRQTDDGAVWWSTRDGVERYNGVNIRQYALGDESWFGTKAGRTVMLARGEKRHELYAFDNEGRIYRFSAARECFETVIELDKLMEGNIILNDVLPVEDGFWLALHSGVYKLKGKNLQMIRDDIRANQVMQIGERILFCTNKGVFSVQADGIRMQQYLTNCHVASGYYDSKYNNVWLGTFQNGVMVVDKRQAQQLLNVSAPLSGLSVKQIAVPTNPVRCFVPLDDKTMLIGIDGFGVYATSRDGNGEARLFLDANSGSQGKLHGNGVYSMLNDNYGNIIIGTYSGGIDILRHTSATVAVFQHSSENEQSLGNDHVNCVAQFGDGPLFLGTDNGISIYNPTKGVWTNMLKGSVVLNIHRASDGHIYAATFGQGVYDITGGAVRPVFNVGNGTLKSNHIYSLYSDREGSLWMGGLNTPLVEKAKTGLRHYALDNVKTITQLADGRMAVGTVNGLFLLKHGDKTLQRLDYGKSIGENINYYILALYQHGSELWIGTDGGGIYVYDLQKKTCRQITTADGLPSNCVCGIKEDRHGKIWISTYSGLAFIAKADTSRVVNVNYSCGLDREYADGSICLLDNGYLLLGSTSGAIVINPEKIRELDYFCKLHVFGLEDGRVLLDYDERTFDLEFESINLQNQGDIVYKYKIGNHEWSPLFSQQYIRFSNLETGTHRLTLCCVSKSTGVVLDEAEVTIVIAQPWWNTWWMWCLYVAMVVAVFYGAWRVYDLHARYMQLSVSMAREMENTHSRQYETTAGMLADPTPAGEENDTEDEAGSGEDEFLGKVTQVIMDNITDADFNIDQLCKEMAMSRTLFYVKLKSLTGKSPQDFMRVIRLERAASLLKQGHSVQDVATLTGFDNPKYFSTVFKKHFGCSPSKYQ